MRSVPLSTLSSAGIHIPEVAGEKNKGPPGDTSIYYFGQGYYPETSVYLLVTGKPGVDEGPQTTYLYAGPTQLYMPNVLRTVDLGQNGTITGRFVVDCRYQNGMTNEGWCKYGMATSHDTSMLSTYNTTARPQTTIQPVRGVVERMRQSTATGLKNVAFPKTHDDAQNAAGRLGPYVFTNALTIALWTTPLALLLALVCL